MSTRGLIGIRVDGERKYSYNHSDSYPSWLGKHSAREFEQLLHDWGIDELRKMAALMKPVNANIPPDITARELFGEYEDRNVGGDSVYEDWYRLFRKAQHIWRPFLTYGIYLGVAATGDAEGPDMDQEWVYEWDLDNQIPRFIVRKVSGVAFGPNEHTYTVTPFDWANPNWPPEMHEESRTVASSQMLDELGDM